MCKDATKEGRGNLILSRAEGESFFIDPSDEPVLITVLSVGKNKTRISVNATKSTRIVRSELEPLTEEPCPASS